LASPPSNGLRKRFKTCLKRRLSVNNVSKKNALEDTDVKDMIEREQFAMETTTAPAAAFACLLLAADPELGLGRELLLICP